MRPDFAAPSAVEPVAPAPDAPAVRVGDDSRTVMTEADVARVLRRIAHEILEHNKGAADLVVLGIPTRGVAAGAPAGRPDRGGRGRPVAVGALDVTMHRDDLRRQPDPQPDAHRHPRGGHRRQGRRARRRRALLRPHVRAALDALSDLGRRASCASPCWSTGGTASCRSGPTTSARTCPTSQHEKVRVRLSEPDDVEDQVTIAGGEAR